MKTTRLFSAAAAVIGLFAASASQAAFFFTDTQSPRSTPATPISIYNDFRGNLLAAGVTNMYLGRSLGVSGPSGQFAIDVDFFASEAGYRNQFRVGSNVLIDNSGNQGWSERDRGTFTTGSYVSRINFSFCAVTISRCWSNSENDTSYDNGQSSSFQSIGMWLSPDRNTAWLLWDDSGAGPDDNHDDLIVRLTYRAVPEPGTLALMGLGLIGVALVRRKTLKA